MAAKTKTLVTQKPTRIPRGYKLSAEAVTLVTKLAGAIAERTGVNTPASIAVEQAIRFAGFAVLGLPCDVAPELRAMAAEHGKVASGKGGK